MDGWMDGRCARVINRVPDIRLIEDRCQCRVEEGEGAGLEVSKGT